MRRQLEGHIANIGSVTAVSVEMEKDELSRGGG